MAQILSIQPADEQQTPGKQPSTQRPIRLARAFVNLVSISYSAGLVGLLLLRLLGRDQRWWVAFLINFIPFYFPPIFVLLTVALLLRARPATLVTLPLAALAIILFAPLYLPKAMPTPVGATLRVISFNVSDANQELESVVDWLREQNADVVMLQEVAAEWFGPIRQELDALYPEQIHQLTEQGGRGNLTLTRFPVVLVPSVTLNSPELQPVILDLEGQPTAFYNVSLATPVEAVPRRDLPFEYPLLDLALRYDTTSRDRQIQQLLNKIALEPAQYLVAGDFNMSDQTRIYGALAARMGDSYREAGFGLGMTWPALQVVGLGDWMPPLLRIDYVWHSREFRAISAQVGPYLGSDHRPVAVTLETLTQP